MRRPLSAVVLCWAATAAVAQPPVYERWTGNTASAQPQGFGQGNPITLTWGFMASGTAINDSAFSGFPNGANNLPARLNQIYGSQATWQPLFAGVFNRWGSVSGLSYQYEPNDDGAALTQSGLPLGLAGVRADVRIGGKPLDGNSNVLAYNYFPNIGDMVIDTGDNFFNTTAGDSLRLRNVVSHEHGHGLGMPHVLSNSTNMLMNPFYSGVYDGPQFHDILAAQHMYGDAFEKTNAGLGNDTAARATPLALANDTVTIGASARSLAVAPTATDFVSIDSATDTDFYRVVAPAGGGPVSVQLRPLGFTYTVTPQNGTADVPFNTTQRSNLALAVFAADGTTLIDSANAAGLGGDEAVTFDADGGATYLVRVTGANNPDAIVLDTQFYELTVGFTPVPEPAAVLAVATITLGGWAVRRRATAVR